MSYYDLDRMRILRELQHRGTMSAVAEALSYSRSAVSQQLAQLEREVGVPILERDGRRVRLTPAGELVAGATERIIVELESLHALVSRSQAVVAGTLNVASMQTVTLVLLPPVTSALKLAHPELSVVTVQAEPDDALSGLLIRDYDAVITESYPQWPVIYPPGVHPIVILEEQLRVASAPSETPRTTGDLRSFRERRWAMEPKGTPAREWASNFCRTAGFLPNLALESADMVAQAHFAARGDLVAFLPDLLWLFLDLDVTLTDVGSEARRELHLVVRDGAESDPAIAAFRDQLLDSIADLSGDSGSHSSRAKRRH
jgi:DNA-binding transcriptional LysR family regulator